MLFVFDTNVLISAALGDGVCRKAFELAQSKGSLVRSVDTFNELVLTLQKPRLQKYLAQNDKVDFLANFLIMTTDFSPAEKIFVCRDAKDNMFLELALSSKADYVITGDGDLLALHPFRGIPILTVSRFITSVDN